MPMFTYVQCFTFPVAAVFDFFRRPACVVAVAPPELQLQLLAAPEVAEVGSRIVAQARRWGISQRIVTEVVELVENSRIVEEQRQGPFRAWRHEREFAHSGVETEVREQIVYEAPGGMLGLMLTAARIEEELRNAFAYREAGIVKWLQQNR